MALWFALALVLIAVVRDLRTREIPDSIPVCLFLVALASTLLQLDTTDWLARLLGLTLGLGVGATLFYLGAMGGGDAKLLAGLGAVTGWLPLLSVLFYTALAGGLLGYVALKRGAKDLAYAPAIGVGFATWLLLSHVAPQAWGMWGAT